MKDHLSNRRKPVTTSLKGDLLFKYTFFSVNFLKKTSKKVTTTNETHAKIRKLVNKYLNFDLFYDK